MRSFFSKILGSGSDSEIRQLNPIVDEVNNLEPEFENLSQQDLRQLMNELREEYEDDDDLDPEDLSDEPYAPSTRRPSDLLVMTPVLLVISAVALFFLSIMSGSAALRTFSMVMVPVSGIGFVMAPLMVMLRSRNR